MFQLFIRADISQVSWENGGGNDSTICLLLQHIYVYLSTTVAETRTTLWHLTLVYTVFPFPAWAHYCAHLASQPCPHCDAFNHPLQVSRSIAICNLSMSWYFYVTEFHFHDVQYVCDIIDSFHSTHIYDLRIIHSYLPSYHQ